jgi:P27 family predicted phage terminase small subunit
MATSRRVRVPRHLKGDGADFYRQVVRAYVLTEPQMKLLQGCCEAVMRVQQARQEIEASGLMVTDRFGQRKLNPAVDAERQAREQVQRHLRDLCLDGDDAGPELMTRAA